MTPFIGVETNLEAKVRVEADHPVVYTIVSTVVSPTAKAIAQPLAYNVKSVDVKTISSLCVEVVLI